MSLPKPSDKYDAHNEAQTRTQIDQALNGAYQRGQDVYIVGQQRFIMPDAVSGALGVVTVTAGVFSWTAL